MSYNTSEVSEQDGNPFFLYKFVRGVTTTTFTSANNTIIHAGDTYVPSPVAHRGINQTGQVERVSLDIVFPKSDSFAMGQFSPDYNQVTFVTIYRGHHTYAEDIQVMWKGRVTSFKVGGSTIVLTCESIQTTLRRQGLRGVYQRGCRHALYGTGCGLDIDDWYVNFTATTVDETTITLSAAPPSDGYYTGGIIKFGSSLGMIVNQTGTTLQLLHQVPSLTSGATVQLAAGCDLKRTTCQAKFDNVLNFGGMPYIPSRNPFTGFIGEPIS